MAIASIGVVIGIFIAATAPAFNGDRVITIYLGATCYFNFPSTVGCSWWFGLLTAFIFTLLPLSLVPEIFAQASCSRAYHTANWSATY